MSAVTLKAHFDGTSIQLDEPYELPPNAELLVTVLAPATDAEASDWLALSRAVCVCLRRTRTGLWRG